MSHDPARWNRLERLFHEALARPPGEREVFVEEACGEDRELREELERLLEADALAKGSLGRIVGEGARAAAGALQAEVAGELRMGPYRLVRELGRGGMGAVWLAERDDEEFRQSVAIKLILPGVAGPGVIRRFLAERQILAGLNHPNIAALLDGGTTEEGHPYLVMEHVEGEPIDRYCEREGLAVSERLELFLAVCSAVQFAHARLIVHRDIKPSNILVTPGGTAKLLDFGIAKILAPSGSGDAVARTGTGLRLMSAPYASPEQIRGDSISIATDVYSLGVLLYELLTGRLPYEVGRDRPHALPDAIVSTEPARPSAAVARGKTGALEAARARGTTPQRLRRLLSGDLDNICALALRKDPEKRYPSVEALAEDVRRHLAGLPVRARGEGLAYRAGKFVRRHRWGLGATAAAVSMLVGFGAFATLQADRLAQERDTADAARAGAEHVAEFLTSIFQVANPSESRGQEVTARDLLDEGARRIEMELAGTPELQATMMRVVGTVYHSLGLPVQARSLIEPALGRHRDLYGELHPEVASSQMALGILLQDAGDLEGAEMHFREALAMRRQLFGPEHPQVSESLSSLAYLVESQGDPVAAEDLFRTALAQRRSFYPPDHPEVVASTVRLARLLRQNGKQDEAEPMLRTALASQRVLYGDDHPDVASTMRNLASLLRDRGAYAEADTLYQQTIALRRAVLGDEHPELANTLNSYAVLLQNMGETERAVAVYSEFISILEGAPGEPHRNLAPGYNNLAGALRDLGREEEALAQFEKARAIQAAMLPERHPDRAFPLMGTASIHRARGDFHLAEPPLREALDLRRQLPPGHRRIGETLSDLGATLMELGRWEEAGALLREAHEILVTAEGSTAGR